MKKGSSPTKRLIDMKKSQLANAKSVKSLRDKTKYSIAYTT